MTGYRALKTLRLWCLLTLQVLFISSNGVAGDTQLVQSQEGPKTAWIHGSVQFWRRLCRPDGRCELPVAASQRLQVHGEIQMPASPTELGTFSIDLEAPSEGLRLSMQAFWRLDAAAPQGSYLAVQSRLVKITEGVMTPLGECSEFLAPALTVFPAGFCAAYREDDGVITQYGVTFYL